MDEGVDDSTRRIVIRGGVLSSAFYVVRVDFIGSVILLGGDQFIAC